MTIATEGEFWERMTVKTKSKKKKRKATAYSNRKNWNDTWLTPPALIKALGKFDLDPACPDVMPWRTARKMLTKADDGLATPWKKGARVWMNPPYKNPRPWCKKFADHGNGICPLNGRSIETAATRYVLDRAKVMLIPAIRLKFCNEAGVPQGSWFPNLLIGLGPFDLIALEELSTHPLFGGVLLYTEREHDRVIERARKKDDVP